MFLRILVLLLILSTYLVVQSKQILELQGVNFELAITSYKYVVVLFYNKSEKGKQLLEVFTNASLQLDGLSSESEIAKINCDDPEMFEVVETYNIKVPAIKVFRRGVMSEYLGSYEVDGMASFILEDSKPSVKLFHGLNEMKQILQTQLKTVILGFFNEEDIIDEDSEAYSVTAWGQFHATADSLRGHAVFYAATSDDVIDSFKLSRSELPLVYMIAEDGDGLIQYTGLLLEYNLSEWILRHTSPALGELTISSATGELFTTQFFSSKKIKFILILTKNHDKNLYIQNLLLISETFSSLAIFAYMYSNEVPDVLDFFSIDSNSDLPMIVCHNPTNDFKYKSPKLTNITIDTISEFVIGVLEGHISKIIKSQPIPKNNNGFVKQLVGYTVNEVVNTLNKDVLVEVYAPWCAHCKKIRSTYDMLGRAASAESRIIISKIDGVNNDIPSSWNVKGYPTLLWFPAKDKPYRNNVSIPRPYWDAGYSLYEMASFIQRESSFDIKTLKIATQEQLGQLLADEEALKLKYELEDQFIKRNEGRDIYENFIIDYMFGEVIYDGKRWHMIGLGISLIYTIIITLLYINSSYNKVNKKIIKKKN